MPIYVYGCKDCGVVEEHIQRFSDPPLTECEKCGGRLEKQITAAAFHLKGGGWYKDGYASAKGDSGDSGSGDSGSGDSGSGDSGSGDSSKKTESKKAESKKSSSKKDTSKKRSVSTK